MSVCASITKQVLPKRARTAGASAAGCCAQMAPGRPADYLRICASGSKGTESTAARGHRLPAQRAAHRCDRGPALWRGPREGLRRTQERRLGPGDGAAASRGAPDHLLHSAVSHSHRAQSEYAHCHPRIHSSAFPPLPLIYEQHPTFMSLPFSCPPVSYIPQPQKVPQHPIKQHVPGTLQVPLPAAWHSTTTHGQS